MQLNETLLAKLGIVGLMHHWLRQRERQHLLSESPNTNDCWGQATCELEISPLNAGPGANPTLNDFSGFITNEPQGTTSVKGS